MYGLKESETLFLNSAFSKIEGLQKVILYGSRAKGTYRPFSDVDITLIGDTLTQRDANRLHAILDESTLPYMFDISIFFHIKVRAAKGAYQARGHYYL